MAKDKDYRDFVSLLAKSGEDRVFLNSNEDHALDVLVQLLQVVYVNMLVICQNIS